MLVGERALYFVGVLIYIVFRIPVCSEFCCELQRRGSHDKDPDKLAKVTEASPWPPPLPSARLGPLPGALPKPTLLSPSVLSVPFVPTRVAKRQSANRPSMVR